MLKRSVFQRARLLFLCALLILPLASCGAAENLLGRLGFDTHDYRGEKTQRVHAPDSETAEMLAAMMRRLSVNSPILTPFSGAKEAADACRDGVLNQLLESGYAQYAGNRALLARAADAYPQLQISVLIPAADFETVIYASFGGSERIVNRSGELFRYLDKIDAYTTAATPQPSSVVTTVLLCEETERTYRLTFENSLDGVVSPAYFALIIKREDGSLYIRSLETAKK